MQPSLFDHRPTATLAKSDVDYHVVPATPKQQNFARLIAERRRMAVPEDVLGDRRKLSDWIDANKTGRTNSKYDQYPSSKQVAFAERIARTKRRHIPPECFRDKSMMSKWIDANR